MAFRAAAQLVLPKERADQKIDCIRLVGIPPVNVGFLALACENTPRSQADVNTSRRVLLLELNAHSARARLVQIPCHGLLPDARECHVHDGPNCLDLLLGVGYKGKE